MKILIVAATTLEIEDTINKETNTEVLITGIGTPATIYMLTKKLNNSSYDLVIQAGIAGSFTNTYTLGEVFTVKEDAFADLGVEEKGNLLNTFDMGFDHKDIFPYANGWLVNKNILLQQCSLPAVTAVTVNKITDNALQNKLVHKKYHAEIESMEGAAFHYVCLQLGVPFIQLRSISNYIGERDKKKWKVKSAILNLNTALQKMIAAFQQ